MHAHDQSSLYLFYCVTDREEKMVLSTYWQQYILQLNFEWRVLLGIISSVMAAEVHAYGPQKDSIDNQKQQGARHVVFQAVGDASDWHPKFSPL